jgi:hypothetical protein
MAADTPVTTVYVSRISRGKEQAFVNLSIRMEVFERLSEIATAWDCAMWRVVGQAMELGIAQLVSPPHQGPASPGRGKGRTSTRARG